MFKRDDSPNAGSERVARESLDDVPMCVCARLQFVFLTYILGVAWLGVFGFSAVPVFLFYNMWSTCATMKSSNLTNIDSICVDVRQYGKAPSPRPGKRLVLP